MLLTFTATDRTSEARHAITARIEELTAKLDQLGKPAWIALMILGFIIWWPVGLGLLAFIIGSGRMSFSKGRSHWHDMSLGALGPAAAVERQPGLRRIPQRNVEATGGGAARVPRVSGSPALRQGQDRVRRVHGRTPQSDWFLGASPRLTALFARRSGEQPVAQPPRRSALARCIASRTRAAIT